MEWLSNIKWTPQNMVKGVGVLLIIILAVAILKQMFMPMYLGMGTGSISALAPSLGWNSSVEEVSYGYGEKMATDGYYADDSVSLSSRNLIAPGMPPMPVTPGTVGNDAEAFEVTSYSATFETRDSDGLCQEVVALKARPEVIFESANEYSRGCSFSFKVEKESVAEVLTQLENWDPKELSENTNTIKRQIDDFTSESDILQNKLAAIDQTLAQATSSYDELIALATRTQDPETLAKVLDSKIGIIERLTQQRISIVAQLERLSRNKAEQLDQLLYTYFYVNVYENKFVDGENLAESWKQATQTFISNTNRTIQDVSINFVSYILTVLSYILYFLVLLVVAKFLWRITRSIWKA